MPKEMEQSTRYRAFLVAVLLISGCHERFNLFCTQVVALSTSLGFQRNRNLSLQSFATRSDNLSPTNFFATSHDGKMHNESSIDKARQLSLEAEELRRKAKTIMAEALEMEADMKEDMALREARKISDSNLLIQKIFEAGRPLTPDATAYVMQNERMSLDQVMGVAENLFFQLWDLDTALAMSAGKEGQGSIVPSNNEEVQSERLERAHLIVKRIDCLIEGADILDGTANGHLKVRWPGRSASTLRSHLNQVRLAHLAQADLAAKKAADNAKQMERANEQESSSNDVQPDETESLQDDEAPLISYSEWILIPKRLRSLWIAEPSVNHSISEADIQLIQSKVIEGTSFSLNSTDNIASTAAIFRGQLRYAPEVEDRALNSNHRATRTEAHDNVTASLFSELNRKMEAYGLTSRVNLFLLNDPRQSIWADLLSGQNKSLSCLPRPVILAVPKTIKPGARPRNYLVGALRQVLITLPIISLFHFSVKSYALNPSFFHGIVRMQESKVLFKCIPIMLGVMAIQAIHEIAHYVVARRKGIRLALPFPIPSFELGTFGCITGLKSFPANRKDLFDFAISGPVASAVSSLACMCIGLHRTLHASSHALECFPTLPVAWFKSSFLSGILLTLLAPKLLTLPLSQPVPIHPLFVVGFTGLLSSALNMLPVARLDGGRACFAAMGPKYGQLATMATFLCTLIAIFWKESASTLLVSWMMYILIFQRRAEVPSRDDFTEINNFRLQSWICSVIFSILALVPFPGYHGLAPISL